MEEVRNTMKVQEDVQRISLGKRSFGSFKLRMFEAGSSSGSYKKPMFDKVPAPGQSQNQNKNLGQGSGSGSGASDKPSASAKGKCDRCMGPHLLHECKWKPVLPMAS